jgi:hypothetical protein
MKMALTHQFLIVPWEQIEYLSQLNKSLFPDSKFKYKNKEKICWPREYADADDVLMSIMSSKCTACVDIHDDLVLPLLHNLETVDTWFGGFIPYSGLNYYGFTLIPFESIQSLVAVLNNAKKLSEFDELLDLCTEAIDKKQCILHCGI